MYSKTVVIAALVAIAEARFAQEHPAAINAIQAITGGPAGVSDTLAGQSIALLLAAANPCAKLTQADLILTQLGTADDAVAAARGLVAAEQNFNPFVVSIPAICSDVTLPVNPLLRGVVPLIDPAVTGFELENANSAKSLTTPFPADGLSVADVMVAAGFSNFTTKAVDGTAGTPGAASGVVAAAPSAAVSSVASAATTAAPAASSVAAAADACVASTTFITVTKAASSAVAAASSATASAAASAAPATPPAAGAATSPVTGVDPGQQVSTLGLDFGTCTPTIKFEAGLNGRKTTEFTFQAIDPVVNKGQQEALNPNIITNRICDQLGNVCGASDAGKAACLDAKAQILALGTRDQTTADAWNTALGFAGTNTNPDNAPQTGLVGHT